MRVVVVGAGAVGQVLAHHLARGGAEVVLLVRPAHAEAARRGFVLYRCRRGRAAWPALFAPDEVWTAVESESIDAVVLAVPSTALDPAWLAALAAATGDATALSIAPGGAAAVRAAFGVRAAAAAIGFMAWAAPLPGEASAPPGTAYWLPPLARIPISGERARVRALVAALRRGGLPAVAHRDADAFALRGAAVLEPLADALLEAGGRRRLPLAPRLAMAALARLAPMDLDRFFAAHYGKLAAQSRRLRARTDAVLDDGAARRLAAMTPNPLDPAGAALKRNVHEIDIAARADDFAAALAGVLAEPGVALGGIDVRRPAERVGLPFAAGERFQGCIRLGGPRWARGLLSWLENRMTSDHAEIVELSPARMRYRYLAGTPFAGESAYEIRALADGACRLEVVFTWQETTPLAIPLIHALGLARHDRAVLAQATAAAARLGVPILRTSIRA